MPVYVEELPLVTKKSSRSGILFQSVGQYVGVPVDRNEKCFSWVAFDNSLSLIVIKREPHRVCFYYSGLQLCTLVLMSERKSQSGPVLGCVGAGSKQP
jgi:hypothetical protein